MEQLAKAGVPVGILIAPILPGLTDDTVTLHTLLAAAKAAGAQWAGGGPLRMGPATRHTLLPWLDAHRPTLARRYREHYGTRQGATPEYQQALRERLDALQVLVGLNPKEGALREREFTTPRTQEQGELFGEQRTENGEL
jgi:DNA repair photolyase